MLDALLPNLGGQSGLNLSSELTKAGILQRFGVKVIGVVDFKHEFAGLFVQLFLLPPGSLMGTRSWFFTQYTQTIFPVGVGANRHIRCNTSSAMVADFLPNYVVYFPPG